MTSISRTMLIADQFNQIGDAARFGVAAAVQNEGDLLFELIAANNFTGVTMNDAAPLFHATHGNTGSGIIDAAGLAAGFELMFDQRDVNGAHFLNNSPRYLVVGPKNFVTAKTEVAKIDDSIQVLPEPRLADRADWYLAADPRLVVGLEYGGLQASPRPRVQLDQAWSVDGVRFKIIHDAGAWAVDFRPLYRSTGVAG